MRLILSLICGFAALWVFGQSPVAGGAGPLVITEEVGLAMSKAQVMSAAQAAWESSFGGEPGGHLTLVDTENGIMEGTARMNYRSKMLAAREETMGVVTYAVTVQARNGQCHLRIHNVHHTGNRAARGGGISMGPVMEGTAPDEHYPGMSLGASRRMHSDLRAAAEARLMEVARKFTARLRLSGTP
jgi:hypothetical protein